jgi:2-oxoglutarate ferredoxin oxidoreductase subunit alpha
VNDLSIFIVGAAGEGIQTIGDVMARSLLRCGVGAFTSKEYESRIRGGNNSYRIRVHGPNAPRHTADVVLSLNSTAAEHYTNVLVPGALILGELAPGQEGIAIPFQSLAKTEFGSPIFANSIAAGALGAVLNLRQDVIEDVIRERFAHVSEEVLQQNVDAVRLGAKRASDSPATRSSISLDVSDRTYAFVSAHEAIPLAAVAAGCRFMAAYPMSPSTGIMTAFAKDPELGVFVVQAEDEIAAINMSLGASAAGARAMTATSGGGFALMVEAVSLAGMSETPLVIVLAQRPGPATGLPTRTAQEDLGFVVHAGHGEFPRAVLAPSDPQDAVHATLRAFDLADRYQMPVLVLTDQFLADSHFSLSTFDIPKDGVSDGLADPESFETYQRYRITEDGVSPRLALGQSKHVVSIDSDEHTEEGHITEDLVGVRPAMVEKRLEKVRRLQREMSPPRAYRTEDAQTVLLGWGSTQGAIQEAIDLLRERGYKMGSLHFTDVWPLPHVSLPDGISYWTVEGNATGQFANLLRREWRVRIEGVIGRYDGLPIDAPSIVSSFTNESTEAET